MFGIFGPNRFHTHHGSNIELISNQTIAVRKSSFANALTFSERAVEPGEIFLVEIEDNESGWSGYMRIGLTQMSPETKFDLPLYALPDLVSIGPSWLFAITKTHNNLYSEPDNPNAQGNPINPNPGEEEAAAASASTSSASGGAVGGGGDNLNSDPLVDIELAGPPGMAAIEQNLFNYRRFPRVVHREGSMIRTPRGLIHENKLLPNLSKTVEKRGMSSLPTDVGSRIGVMFVPTSDNEADMHFVINGDDQGPCARNIPYKDAPIYAVVDVYGSTKKVKIVQFDEAESLQSLCRDTILRSIKLSGVSNLPLPKLLKDYLLFNF